MISVYFQGKPFNITVIQVYAPTSNAEEAEVEQFFFFSFIFISWRLITLQYCSGFCHTLTWISLRFTCEVEQFYEDLQDLLQLTPEKDVLFIIGDWNAKVGSQETPGVTGNLALEYRMKEGKG